MRGVVSAAAIAVVVTISSISIAEAGLRDRCAASTGARSGAAFSACVSAGIARGEGRENDSRSRGSRSAGGASKGALCQQRAGFTQAQWEAGQTSRAQRKAWERCMQS